MSESSSVPGGLAFARFCGVGTVGYLVDTAILYQLKDALGLVAGRGVSLAAAMMVTWWLNRRYTFKHRPLVRSIPGEVLVYSALMSVGALINFIAYLVASELSALVRAHPLLGVAIGSVCGLSFNFVAARMLLESKKTV